MGLLDDLFRGPGLLNAGPGLLNGAAHGPAGTPGQPAPFGWAPMTADSMIQQARKQLSEQNAPPDEFAQRELRDDAAAGINIYRFGAPNHEIIGRHFPGIEAGGADYPPEAYMPPQPPKPTYRPPLPADRDPFEAAAARVRNAVRPAGGREEGRLTQGMGRVGEGIARMGEDLLTLPKRAIDASAADVQHRGDPDWKMQSVGPALETALWMTGGAGIVPAEANALRTGMRYPFRENFPQVVVQRPPNSPMRITQHPDYAAAKAGDAQAAMRVVDDAIDGRAMAKLEKLIGDRRPTIVPVHAQETGGRNALPQAYAQELAGSFGLPVDREILQANRAFRTGAGADYRMRNNTEFHGNVRPDADHLLVDDNVTMGGTLADLHSHIAAGGGRVLGATTLMAGPFSHILAPTRTTLERLRDKLPQLEPWWKSTYGHGFEGLTDSEAKYLTGFGSTDAVRDRLAAGARSPAGRRNPGDPEGTGQAGGAGTIKGDTE